LIGWFRFCTLVIDSTVSSSPANAICITASIANDASTREIHTINLKLEDKARSLNKISHPPYFMVDPNGSIVSKLVGEAE
jgi:hypothetical protein